MFMPNFDGEKENIDLPFYPYSPMKTVETRLKPGYTTNAVNRNSAISWAMSTQVDRGENYSMYM